MTICRPVRREPVEPGASLAVEEDEPPVEKHDAIGHRKHPLDTLLGEHDCDSEPGDVLDERLCRRRVELRGRLVEKEQLRPQRERGREADPLQLAARELGGSPACEMERADCGERVLGAAVDLGRRSADVLEPERDLVANDAHDDLVLRVLKDGRDGSGQLGRAGLACVATVDGHLPAELAAVKMRNESCERPNERRFPRPGRPEERDDLAGLDTQRDGRERRGSRSRVRERDTIDEG